MKRNDKLLTALNTLGVNVALALGSWQRYWRWRERSNVYSKKQRSLKMVRQRSKTFVDASANGRDQTMLGCESVIPHDKLLNFPVIGREVQRTNWSIVIACCPYNNVKFSNTTKQSWYYRREITCKKIQTAREHTPGKRLEKVTYGVDKKEDQAEKHAHFQAAYRMKWSLYFRWYFAVGLSICWNCLKV